MKIKDGLGDFISIKDEGRAGDYVSLASLAMEKCCEKIIKLSLILARYGWLMEVPIEIEEKNEKAAMDILKKASDLFQDIKNFEKQEN